MRRAKIWIPVSIAALALVITLVLVFTWPSSEPSRVEPQSSEETVVEESADQQSGAEQGEQPGESQGQASEQGNETGNGQGGVVNPGGTGNGTPGMVVEIPDPVDEGWKKPTEEVPGDEEQPSISGQWVVEMNGAGYGFKNLYIRLEKEGNISVPDDYNQIFDVKSSQYIWEAGKPDFSASIQLVLKMGSEQTAIPILIEFSGKVSESLKEIEGSVVATPQGEMQVPINMQGTFKMQR